MAKVAFSALGDYALALERYQSAADSGKMLERAIATGAAIVADQIRANLQALPEEKFRKLQSGETFRGLPKNQKQDLADSFGLTPIGRDKTAFYIRRPDLMGTGAAQRSNIRMVSRTSCWPELWKADRLSEKRLRSCARR